MKMKNWRQAKGLTLQQVADRLQTTKATVWRYEMGMRVPDDEMARRIVELTHGDVQPNDFYPQAQAALERCVEAA